MQREETRHISSFIKAFVRENHLEEGLLEFRVLEAWDAVVGAMSSTEGVRPAAAAITSGKSFRNGVLTVRMKSSVLRMQFRMSSDSILRKVNARLDGPVVTKIIFQ